ncbi:hypothetical protein [Klebsiella pneumoniae]|uniref:hypothetical protein n=1 Tax=Klebsiella pneumoniae TaxID=573 RepID=UPI001D0DBD9F|nr:hypothetical protein [Klebsiella pneumoniae]
MSCEELPITDINTEMEKVLPAHFELAISKLETLSTKLTPRLSPPDFIEQEAKKATGDNLWPFCYSK